MDTNIIERRANWFVALLLVLIFVQCFFSIKQKSITNDELTHIASGYSYIKTADFRMNPEHPPLVKLLSAVPLLFLDLNIPTDHITWANSTIPLYANRNQWDFGTQFLYGYNPDADKIVLFARIPVVLLSLLFGLYVFKFAKEVYGEKAGLFALFLYAFCPNILAHSRLVTTDIGIAGFSFIAVYYLWKFLAQPNIKHSILLGLFTGLAFATKFTAIYIIPIFFVLAVVYFLTKKENNFKNVSPYNIITFVLVIIFLSYLVFIGSYFFGELSSVKAREYFSERTGINNPFISVMLKMIPLPAPFLTGFADVIIDSKIGRPAFLMGDFSVKGWWYYYPIAFLIKTPVPVLLFIILSLVLFKKIKHSDWFNEAVLFVPILLLGFIFILSHWNIGLRHILPVYPFLFVFVSKLINNKKLKWVIIVLSLWYLVSSLLIFPHYLEYFNELIGGPANGYKYLIDSNLDWGQDLKLLKKWMAQNNIDFIKLAYWGKDNPTYRGVDYELLECYKPETGLVAVSVNYLIGFSEQKAACLKWLRESDNKPIDRIAYTIFIYNMTS